MKLKKTLGLRCSVKLSPGFIVIDVANQANKVCFSDIVHFNHLMKSLAKFKRYQTAALYRGSSDDCAYPRFTEKIKEYLKSQRDIITKIELKLSKYLLQSTNIFVRS